MVNFCAGFATLLSVAAVILLIFGEIGQLDNSLITRHLRIVSINVENLQASLAEQLNTGRSNLTDLFHQGEEYHVKGQGNVTQHDGLRKVYEWGLWNYCASSSDDGLGSTRSYCTPRQFGAAFQPAAALLEDVPEKYQQALKTVLPDSVFTADDYLGNFTMAASYMVFVGSILAGICLLIGLLALRSAYFTGLILSLLSALCLSIGLVIYTVIFSRVISAIKDVQLANDVDLGVDVEMGNALYLMWAGAALMIMVMLPFSIACCTGRSDRTKAIKPSGGHSRPQSISSSQSGGSSMRKSMDMRSLPK